MPGSDRNPPLGFPPQMYRVEASFDVEDAREATERLERAFADARPIAAMPTGIRPDDGYVTVEFDRLPDDPHAGPTTVDEGAPGGELISALEGFQRRHTLLVPVLRALLSVSTACNRAGLAPGEELDVMVRPAEPLSPESASSQLFDAAPEAERPTSAFRFRRR